MVTVGMNQSGTRSEISREGASRSAQDWRSYGCRWTPRAGAVSRRVVHTRETVLSREH